MKDIVCQGSSVNIERKETGSKGPQIISERSSQRARKYEQASAILAGHQHNDILTGDELAFMRAVFVDDPRFPGVAINSIKVAHAPRPYSMFKCFWCRIEDGAGRGEWVPWSLKKALGYKVKREEVRHD